jgi:hypothetical protein
MLTYSLLFKIGAKSGPSRVSRGRPVPGACGGDYGGAVDGHLLFADHQKCEVNHGEETLAEIGCAAW